MADIAILVMVLVVVLLVAVFLISLPMWIVRQSSGSLSAVTNLSRREVLDELVQFFVLDDWIVQHKAGDFVVLQKKASGATGCLLLLLFFPLGLAYLLTDWGTGKTTIRVWEGDDVTTDVEIEWRNAPIRGPVEQAVRWLEKQ